MMVRNTDALPNTTKYPSLLRIKSPRIKDKVPCVKYLVDGHPLCMESITLL